MVVIVIITIMIHKLQLIISSYRKIQVVLKIRPCLPMRLFSSIHLAHCRQGKQGCWVQVSCVIRSCNGEAPKIYTTSFGVKKYCMTPQPLLYLCLFPYHERQSFRRAPRGPPVVKKKKEEENIITMTSSLVNRTPLLPPRTWRCVEALQLVQAVQGVRDCKLLLLRPCKLCKQFRHQEGAV